MVRSLQPRLAATSAIRSVPDWCAGLVITAIDCSELGSIDTAAMRSSSVATSTSSAPLLTAAAITH
jgi:hypothetical protein